MRLPSLALAAAFLSCSFVAHADLLGNTVDVNYAYPDAATTLIPLGTFTVPSTGVISYVGSFELLPSQIVITSSANQDFAASAFNGFEFTVTGMDPMISGVTLDPASTFTQGAITFTSNSVFLNFSGLHANPGQQAIFDLSFGQPPVVGATPEPSSFALMGSGLLGVAGVMRKRYLRS